MKVKLECIQPALPDIRITLTHSAKRAKRIVKRFAGKEAMRDWEDLGNKDGATSILQNAENGEVFYLIWISPNLDRNAATDAEILAHEATHVAKDYLRDVGEDDPSEELLAYTMQAVTGFLADEHWRWKKRKLEKQ